MIRLGTRADLPALVGMAGRFHAASPAAPLKFLPEQAARSAMSAIDDPEQLCLILDIGGPCGALLAGLTVYPLGDAVLAKETVFWIEPHARGRWALRMIAAYETWAKASGAAVIGLSCFNDDRTERLFVKAGFNAAEINTIKGL